MSNHLAAVLGRPEFVAEGRRRGGSAQTDDQARMQKLPLGLSQGLHA